jgi:hypothetical protein
MTAPLSDIEKHFSSSRIQKNDLVGGFNHLEKYYCSRWEGLSHILWKIKNV